MTIPKIVQVAGGRNSEYVILMCTGCNEYYSYSVRQYKGDFGCNISEFEQFLQWAKWEAAKHECFLAGRVGYIEDPRDATPDDPLAYHVDFPQVERHEDPWGEQAMREAVNPLLQGNAPDGTPYDDLGEEDEPDYIDDDEVCWPDEACMSHEECDMEPCIYAGEQPEDETAFTFLLDVHEAYRLAEKKITGTGRMRRDPDYIFELRPMPRKFEGKMVTTWFEIDYAGTEQRMVDTYLLAVGFYSLDVHGCLRDEKNRCLACLRPGPHLPFYWERREIQ